MHPITVNRKELITCSAPSTARSFLHNKLDPQQSHSRLLETGEINVAVLILVDQNVELCPLCLRTQSERARFSAATAVVELKIAINISQSLAFH